MQCIIWEKTNHVRTRASAGRENTETHITLGFAFTRGVCYLHTTRLGDKKTLDVWTVVMRRTLLGTVCTVDCTLCRNTRNMIY